MSEHARLTDRALPHSLDAEKAILGACLIDPSALTEATDEITAEDFYRAAHRWIFVAMATLVEAGEPVDFLTVKVELDRIGKLDECGGPAYLSALTDGIPHGSNVESYAGIVREKAALRKLIYAGNKLVSQAYDASEPAETILEEAERTVIGLAEKATPTGFQSMRSIADRGLDYLGKVTDARQAIGGIPSGLPSLDQMTLGFQPKDLILIGGRPGMGKTTLAMNIAQHVATCPERLVVGVFSLEMSTEQLFLRQVSSTSGIDSQRLRSGQISTTEWGKITRAIGVLSESHLHVDETPAITAYNVRARCRKLRAEHGLDLVLIDYVQLMAGKDKRRETNRALELGEISGALKALAKELNIPVIALSQLSRPDKRDTNPRPRLADLRDSGALEQDADMVLFLWRSENDEYLPDGGLKSELIISKQRSGPVGTVYLSWHRYTTRFAEYVEQDEYADRRLPMGDR